MLVRLLDREEESRILALYTRCADYFLMTSGEMPVDCDELFEDLPPDTAPEAKEVFGIIEGERLIGVVDFVSGFPDSDTAIIGFLLIDPAYRGRGVGREVVERLADKATGKGLNRLRVAVIEANEAADHFWRKQGFEEVLRTEPRPYGKKTHRVIAMVRTLDE